MKKKSIFKKALTAMLSMVMVLGAVSTSWAGNVYGDDGSHIKIMTTAGELASLPKTDFKGESVYLIPEGTEVWVASEGSTANPYTISLGIVVDDKNEVFDKNSDEGHFIEWKFEAEARSSGAYPPFFDFDKHYPLFHKELDTSSDIYLLTIFDEEDGSFQEIFYLLDDGSYPVMDSGWKQDSTGWWYQNADGSYPKSTWQLIGGKYYYFDESGYMLSNTTTPDGYQVDESGAWIQ